MINEKTQNEQNNKKNNDTKKIRILVKIQITFASLFFLLFWGFLIIGGPSEGAAFIIIMIAPFYWIFLLINIGLAISFMVIKKKKEILYGVLSIILVLSPIIASKINDLYEKYLKSVSSCEKEKSEHWRSYCYLNLAVDRNDVNICYKINEKNSWRNECMWIVTKDSSFCKNIINSYDKDRCIAGTAIKSEQCKIIEDVSIEENCFSKFKP